MCSTALQPGILERMIACTDRFSQIERATSSFEDRCRTTINRCDAIELLCRNFLCPGNVNFLAAYARRVQRQEPGQAHRGRHGPG